MWLYFKAIKEARKKFKEECPNDFYVAEMGIGYALTHYPMFMLETIAECAFIVWLIVAFGK